MSEVYCASTKPQNVTVNLHEVLKTYYLYGINTKEFTRKCKKVLEF